MNKFKEEVMALVSGQGYTVQQAVKSLGIPSNLPYCLKTKNNRTVAGTRPHAIRLSA